MGFKITESAQGKLLTAGRTRALAELALRWAGAP